MLQMGGEVMTHRWTGVGLEVRAKMERSQRQGHEADVRRPQGRELGKANEVAEWNGKVGGVSVKGGRIHWEVASSCRSQKERAGGEGSKGRVLEGRDSG